MKIYCIYENKNWIIQKKNKESKTELVKLKIL